MVVTDTCKVGADCQGRSRFIWSWQHGLRFESTFRFLMIPNPELDHIGILLNIKVRI